MNGGGELMNKEQANYVAACQAQSCQQVTIEFREACF